MSKFLWWITAEDCTEEMLLAEPTFVVAHAVPERGEPNSEVKTLCGQSVPQLGPDTAWRMRDSLGNWRICDNCGRDLAIHEDAGDQPEVI